MNVAYNEEDLSNHEGIAAVIKNERGEILIQEHAKFGFWTIPVGKVKEGQSVIDGLRQEISEECNLDVLECKELVAKDFHYVRDGREVSVSAHLFDVSRYSGELKNLEPDKHKQQVFMPLEEIVKLSYLSDLTLLYLNYLGLDRPAVLQ